MTSKEKAKELIDKMRDEIPCHCDDWEQAKQMEKEQSEKIRTNALLNSKCKYCGGEDKGQ
jgi:hypothetical protein